MMKSALKSLLAKVLTRGAQVHRGLYELHLLDSYKAAKPVLSVGNLSAGGVGKTPLVDWLLQECSRRGLKPAVLSRSYKARVREPWEVKLTAIHPESFFGDEPVMLKRKWPQFSFFVGAKKYQVAQFVDSRAHDFDLYIVDDGFQHHSLKKDFSICVCDASQPLSSYQAFPLGTLRESVQEVRNSDFIVLSKCPGAPGVVDFIQKQALPRKVFQAEYVLQNSFDPNKKYFLVAGIGNPQFLLDQVKNACSCIGYKIFQDHHPYTSLDWKSILTEATGADVILTTAKDWVKLQSLVKSDFPSVQVLEAKWQWLNEPRELYEFLDQLQH